MIPASLFTGRRTFPIFKKSFQLSLVLFGFFRFSRCFGTSRTLLVLLARGATPSSAIKRACGRTAANIRSSSRKTAKHISCSVLGPPPFGVTTRVNQAVGVEYRQSNSTPFGFGVASKGISYLSTVVVLSSKTCSKFPDT